MNKAEIYLAGGCFWGVEHFFKGVRGVYATTPGYANGNTIDPTYQQVYTDKTGFAETVRIEYNADIVSTEHLLKLFFMIIDPLSVNRQGNDRGTRYRTGVYYTTPADRAVAEKVFADESAREGEPVVTELEPLRCFYPAEEYHVDYLDKNPSGYCHLPLKTFRYLSLYQDLKALIGGEPDTVARMAQTSALIKERMGFFWVGYYRVLDGELVLGPFQGPSACFRIGFGKGVCGTAWKENSTVVVPNVEEFPGHIACSSLSKSEIVVPVRTESGEVVAVLDIDSDQASTFDGTDARWLELIAGI